MKKHDLEDFFNTIKSSFDKGGFMAITINSEKSVSFPVVNLIKSPPTLELRDVRKS